MAEEVLKLLGKRIRDLRKERGLTQEQLAEIIGFHYTYIGSVERAENNISTLNLEKIAKALNVGIQDLFEYSKISSSGKGKSQDFNNIIKLLLTLNPREVKKARIILDELFNKT